jgi:sec-independent protein translocase protein TatA
MSNIGMGELVLIFLVILLVFGAKRIPEIARGLGKGIREFKDATVDIKREMNITDPHPSQQIGQGGYGQQPYGQQADQRGYVPPPTVPYGQQPYGQPGAAPSPYAPPAPGQQMAAGPDAPVAPQVPGMPPATPASEGQVSQS